MDFYVWRIKSKEDNKKGERDLIEQCSFPVLQQLFEMRKEMRGQIQISISIQLNSLFTQTGIEVTQQRHCDGRGRTIQKP